MHMIEFAILAEFVVFGPCAHQARCTFGYRPLIEWNPDLAPPFWVVIKTIERIGEVNCCVDIQHERRSVRVGREKVSLTGHLNHTLSRGHNISLANGLGDFPGRK
jgi:hypothetical protein